MPHPDFLRAERHIYEDPLRRTLMEMVNIPSPTGGEGEMATYLEGRLRRAGLRTQLQEVSAGRPNAAGTLPGTGGGVNLLFTGHMDTSYGGDEDYLDGEGFKPRAVYRDGWIWGLGANNMKSGLACALVAVEAIAEEGISLPGDISLAGVVGEIEKAPIEEFQGESFSGYGTGTRHLITHGVTADCAILAEPTSLQVSNANMGCIWAKITATGTMAHSAYGKKPGHRNAVEVIHRIQSAVMDWAPGYSERNEFMGERPSVTIAAVKGGLTWRLSRNPFEASLYIDVRTVPGQTADQVKRELRALLKNVAAESGEPEAGLSFYVNDPATLIDPGQPVIGAMRAAHEEITGAAAEPVIRLPAADSTHFNRYDIPCAVYGPGGFSHPDAGTWMHAAGEHISVANMLTAARVYLAAALDICSRTPA
jgi:acetylornithine deacetylase/succinyl-diaminopimelate desuccinylase-like protein